MLKKLIKHEFKATWRIFVPMLIGVIIAAALVCGFSQIKDYLNETIMAITAGVGITVLVLGYIFVLISPFLFLALRFYKSTATREAYLTFTIPCTSHQIILSKFLVGFFWAVVVFAVWYASFGVMVYSFAGEAIFREMMTELFDAEFMGPIIMTLVSAIIGLATSVLSIIAAISLSQFVKDHRIIASIAFYALIYTVQQIIAMVITIPWAIGSVKDVMTSTTTELAEPEVLPVYIVTIIASSLIGVACYFISNHMLSKKLNLL